MNYPRPENISAAVLSRPTYISVPGYNHEIEPSGLSDGTKAAIMFGAAMLVLGMYYYKRHSVGSVKKVQKKKR
jgi:hypothetical protein